MIEFDSLLREMGQVGSTQKVQLFLLMLPGFLAAMHMGSNVFIGAEIDHWCTFDENKTNLEQTCNNNWTELQDARFRPYDAKVESTHMSQCKMYDLSWMNSTTDEQLCEYWWPSSNESERVNTTMECTKWTFATDGVFQSTIVSTFGLVCGQTFKRKLSQAFFMCGVAFGATFWGQVSDRRGRKTAIIGAGFCAAVFSVVNTFAPSFFFFLVARVLIGFTVFPPFSSAFVLATELVPPKYRVMVAQACQMAFAVGFCALALVGYFIRDWRTLQLVIALPLFTFVIFYWTLLESPRWLISRKKFVRANDIVKKLLKGVGKSSDFKEATKLEEAATHGTRIVRQQKTDTYELDDDVSSTKHRYGPADLLRTPNVRKKSLVLFYSWLTASCGYYGLTLNAAELGGDPYINLLLSGIIEVPACIASIFLMDKWGRRPTLSSSFILAGTACIAMQAVTKEMRELNIVLSLAGKFGSSAAFATVYIYASEIYATPIRNVGIGVCSTCARVGGILAPFIAMLKVLSAPLPYVVFGGLSIAGGLSCLLLPETNGTQLPETIAECESFGANQLNPLRRIFCCEREAVIESVMLNDTDNHKYEECNRNDQLVINDEEKAN